MTDKWDLRFINLAEHIAGWSKDPSTQVGAVIVDPTTRKVVSMGFNGFPRGVDDSDDRLQNREKKLSYMVHAEENAILQAGQSVAGCNIYIHPTIMIPACCAHCAKLITKWY